MYKSIVFDSMCLVTNDSLRGSNAELAFDLEHALQNPVCNESFVQKAKAVAKDVGICGLCFGGGYILGKISP